MSRFPDQYEETDKRALRRALVALRLCPHCRRDLRPAITGAPGVWACVTCDELWPQAEAPPGGARWGPRGWESGPDDPAER